MNNSSLKMNYFYFIIFFISINTVVGQNKTIDKKDGKIAVGQNKTIDKDGKIVGGYYTDIKYFPYQVQLTIYYYGGASACGGSIISSQWVLTAGHCLYFYGLRSVNALVGTTYLNSGGSVHTGVQYAIHPNYIKMGNIPDYDVAVVSFTPNFPIGTTNVNTVKLSSTVPSVGWYVTVAGWGLTSGGGSGSYTLKGLQERVISFSSCSNYYGSSLTGRMICAMADPGNAACNGDSGGALVDSFSKVQYGIVSWGRTDCSSAPDVYTNVAYFRNWIYSMTGV